MILKLNTTPWIVVDTNAWIVTETNIYWMFTMFVSLDLHNNKNRNCIHFMKESYLKRLKKKKVEGPGFQHNIGQSFHKRLVLTEGLLRWLQEL